MGSTDVDFNRQNRDSAEVGSKFSDPLNVTAELVGAIDRFLPTCRDIFSRLLHVSPVLPDSVSQTPIRPILVVIADFQQPDLLN